MSTKFKDQVIRTHRFHKQSLKIATQPVATMFTLWCHTNRLRTTGISHGVSAKSSRAGSKLDKWARSKERGWDDDEQVQTGFPALVL